MVDARDLQAAAVADRLRSFRNGPASAAPRFLEGAEMLPDGGFVLRFAQGKFPSALRLSAREASELRDAADEFVRRVCLSDRADHYQVLCARRDAPHEAIKENYHLLMALLHPDRQEGAPERWPEACAQRVNLAYATLGDEAMRREYDARLRVEHPARQRRTHAPRGVRAGLNQVRFAKTLMALSAVVATVLVAGLMIEDDEWGDRSVLHAALARLGANPVPGSERPRYVGATVMAERQRATDAITVEEREPFAFLKPLMRVLVPEEPKAWEPVPRIDSTAALAPAVRSETPALRTETRAVRTETPAIHAETRAVRAETPSAPELHVAPVMAPVQLAQAAPSPSPTPASHPSNQEIEMLVVTLIGYYEAGDADRLVSLVDGGYWRTAQLRQTYADFFRATRARRLRVERLTWDTQSGAARAKGEATVTAEYFDQSAPVQRRVDVELDIAMREGRPRITRLALFPGQ